MAKKRILFAGFLAPGVIALIRLVVTLYICIWRPSFLPLHWFQLIPLLAIGVHCFMYFKLFRDGVPVISVLLPTMLHFVIVLFVVHIMAIAPFVLLMAIDILFLIACGIKSSMFPYSIDEDDEDEELERMLESLGETE